MTRHRLLAPLVLAALAASAPACRSAERPPEAAPVRVAAAADLTGAFEEIGRQFEAETGERVVLSFAASGQLAQQIKEGAPFDVFAAANVAFVDAAIAAGACDGSTKGVYARGRLALWSRGERLRGLADLADPRFAHVALANPEHAPYGMAARAALRAAGLWDAVEGRLVYGENVRQALQFAETGNADAALVAFSLVVEKKEGQHVLVDEALHAPMDQAIVACRGGARLDAGREFVAHLRSGPSRETMRRHGFLLPGEAASAP